MKILLALLLSISAGQAISVSLSGSEGSIASVLTGTDDSQISGSLTMGESLKSQIVGHGDVTIGQAAAGGREEVSFVGQAPDITSEIGVSQGGVFGRIESEGSEILSPTEVSELAQRPDVGIQKSALTRSGKLLLVNGGSMDVSAPWYIDPAASYVITTAAFDYPTDYVDPSGNWIKISHNQVRAALVKGQNFVNSATGLPVIDGIVESSSISWGVYDGRNCVLYSDYNPAYRGLSVTRYYTGSRKVVDSDTLVNTHYDSDYLPANPHALDNMEQVEIHEMIHSAGMLDWSAARYPGVSIGQTIMGNARDPTSVDRTLLWYKYNT